MKTLWSLTLFAACLMSCRQISKSIEETFKSADSTAAEKKITPAESEKDTISVALPLNEILPKTTKSTAKPTAVNLLKNTAALERAEKQLRALTSYAGKEIYIYQSVHFYNDGRINLMLRHPENPKYVDSYTYSDGAWSEPKPVQLSVRDRIEDRMVPLDELEFASAARVAAIYNEKTAQIDGAKPTDYTYVIIWDKSIRWYPLSINGSRERYGIEFNTDGSLKRFQQD